MEFGRGERENREGTRSSSRVKQRGDCKFKTNHGEFKLCRGEDEMRRRWKEEKKEEKEEKRNKKRLK